MGTQFLWLDATWQIASIIFGSHRDWKTGLLFPPFEQELSQDFRSVSGFLQNVRSFRLYKYCPWGGAGRFMWHKESTRPDWPASAHRETRLSKIKWHLLPYRTVGYIQPLISIIICVSGCAAIQLSFLNALFVMILTVIICRHTNTLISVKDAIFWAYTSTVLPMKLRSPGVVFGGYGLALIIF